MAVHPISNPMGKTIASHENQGKKERVDRKKETLYGKNLLESSPYFISRSRSMYRGLSFGVAAEQVSGSNAKMLEDARKAAAVDDRNWDLDVKEPLVFILVDKDETSSR